MTFDPTVIIGGLLSILGFLAVWGLKELIANLKSLNNTVTTNNIYQKQHFDMLKKHEVRIFKLEHPNGKSSKVS